MEMTLSSENKKRITYRIMGQIRIAIVTIIPAYTQQDHITNYGERNGEMIKFD